METEFIQLSNLREQRERGSHFRMDPPKLGTAERKHVQHEIEKWKNVYEKESRTLREKGGEPGINTLGTQEEERCGHGGGGPTGKKASGDKIHVSFSKGASEETEQQPNCKYRELLDCESKLLFRTPEKFHREGRRDAGNLRSIMESSLW